MTRRPAQDRDRRLDGLLARGRIARPERERILQAVVGQHGRAPTEGRWWSSHPILATAAIVAALLAIGPILWIVRGAEREGPAGSGLRVKGAPTATTADVVVGCREGTCTSGSVLMFRVGGLERPAYLAAYAIGPQGRRIWYFPSAESGGPRLAGRRAQPAVLDKGIVIGAEHPPGEYRIVVLLSRVPLSRQQIRRMAPTDDCLLGRFERTIRVARTSR